MRFKGAQVQVPVELHATRSGLTLRFSGAVEAASAAQLENFACKVWDLKRTANYGSDHYNERRLDIESATLEADGKTLHLKIPEIAPTWCLELKYLLKSAEGRPVRGVIHSTIHRLGAR